MTTTKRYAQNTTVTPAQSRAEIERLLARYKATEFAYASRPGEYDAIEFEINGLRYRFYVRHPAKNDRDALYDGRGARRSPVQEGKAREQIVRQRWRALKLYINATLEAVTSGVTTMQEALFSHLVLPDGSTMLDFMQDNLETLREGTPPALPAPRDRRE